MLRMDGLTALGVAKVSQENTMQSELARVSQGNLPDVPH